MKRTLLIFCTLSLMLIAGHSSASGPVLDSSATCTMPGPDEAVCLSSEGALLQLRWESGIAAMKVLTPPEASVEELIGAARNTEGLTAGLLENRRGTRVIRILRQDAGKTEEFDVKVFPAGFIPVGIQMFVSGDDSLFVFYSIGRSQPKRGKAPRLWETIHGLWWRDGKVQREMELIGDGRLRVERTSVSMDENGGLLLAWMDRFQSGSRKRRLRSARFDADGVMIGKITSLMDMKDPKKGDPALVEELDVTADGAAVVYVLRNGSTRTLYRKGFDGKDAVFHRWNDGLGYEGYDPTEDLFRFAGERHASATSSYHREVVWRRIGDHPWETAFTLPEGALHPRQPAASCAYWITLESDGPRQGRYCRPDAGQ